MKVNADLNVCIGAGNCAQVAGMVFAQRERDGLVVVLQEDPPPQLTDTVRKAVRLCPSGALSLSET